MRTQGCSGSVQPGRGPREPESCAINSETSGGAPRPAVAPAKQGWRPAHRGTSGDSLRGQSSPGVPCLSPLPNPQPPGSAPTVLTSSLCVDGHFFRRRPQLSRFPVCRCRVLARARSAPAARLSVPMAAAARGDPAAPGPQREGEREDGCLAGRGGVPRPQRRARGCRLRAVKARCALGPEEAGRRRRGGPGGRKGGRRRRGRSLRLLPPPLEPPPPPPK